MSLGQVCLCLNEMCMEFSPGFFRPQLGVPGLAVFLKLACIHDEAVCYAYVLSLCDGLDRRYCVVYPLLELRIEDLERIFGVEGFPQFRAACREVHVQYPCVLEIDRDEQEENFHDVVAHKSCFRGER